MTLLSARAVEQRLAKAARRKRIAASPGSGNPGNPGEAWGHLTGRWPGSSVDKRKNPFLRFVVAAWEDVFGKDKGRRANDQQRRGAATCDGDPRSIALPGG
jgi:hypothetical protein